MIKELDILHFRNLYQQKIQFSPGLNIFIGQNGQGKTNLLEAVFYLLTGKSYRVQKESELIRWGETAFKLNGLFEMNQQSIHLESIYLDKKKIIKVNGIACRRLSAFIGLINVIFFSPNDVLIVKDTPGKRRLFIDTHIIQIKPSYVGILNAYNRIIAQKNSLLRREANGKKIHDQLELWNEELLKYGSEILKLRHEFIFQLKDVAIKLYQQISSDSEIMDMQYTPLGYHDIHAAVEEFPVLLRKKMGAEIERQMVLVGPHRDDIEIMLNKRNSRMFASQGQQRSLILALKLAQLEVIKHEKGEYPLLLLDDVLSELDMYRRRYLIRFIEDSAIQTLMTNAIEEKDCVSGAAYLVEQGQVKTIG